MARFHLTVTSLVASAASLAAIYALYSYLHRSHVATEQRRRIKRDAKNLTDALSKVRNAYETLDDEEGEARKIEEEVRAYLRKEQKRKKKKKFSDEESSGETEDVEPSTERKNTVTTPPTTTATATTTLQSSDFSDHNKQILTARSLKALDLRLRGAAESCLRLLEDLDKISINTVLADATSTATTTEEERREVDGRREEAFADEFSRSLAKKTRDLKNRKRALVTTIQHHLNRLDALSETFSKFQSS